MDTIILAGGYAKRMAPTTNEVPKHLLPVAGRPMLNYALDSLEELYSQTEGVCYLSVNKKFEADFRNFIRDSKTKIPLELIVEDTTSEGQKLGSVGALYEIFKQGRVSTQPGTLVIGGDNLFSLNLIDFVNAFTLQEDHYKRQGVGQSPSLFATYDLESLEMAKLYGIVELLDLSAGGLNKPPVREITSFKEKDNNPNSTLASTAIYIFGNTEIDKMEKYLSESDGDAMGNFLEWILYNPETIYPGQTVNLQPPRIFALPFQGYWFDIGSHESFEEANRFFRGKE